MGILQIFIISILIVGIILLLILPEINIIIKILIIGIIIFISLYIFHPTFSLKTRIVNETNYNKTLEDVNRELNEEEIKYYKLAILSNSKETIYNHSVNYIIKIGEDLSKTKISNYIN